ncbi:MAG: right-handed parallel beta-helix repeat-containing protein [Candidatus Diapherotrites archaeon]|nr:right-handed parallel beta-helix repeat-containing protein [Candidatus Diapherotrites archaeon]
MKKIFLLVFLLALLPFCYATDYYVAKTGCSDSGSGTLATPFCTLAKAASEADTPGDTVYIKAGTYNEPIRITHSGSAGNPITFKNYANDSPIIENASSYDSTVGESYGPIWLDHVDYILIEGLTIQNCLGFARALDSHYNTIRNNNFLHATVSDRASKRGGLYFAYSNYNKILNNLIVDGTDSLSLINSHHNLVQGNSFNDAGHDPWTIKCGNYNIVRGNYIHNDLQKGGGVCDCDSDVMNWHGNGEFRTSSSNYDATKHNLIEKNVFAKTALRDNYSAENGIQYAGQDGILRNNIFYDIRGSSIGFALYGGEASYNYGNRTYNNVFYDNDHWGVSVPRDLSYTFNDTVFKNNIFYKNTFVRADFRDRWFTDLYAAIDGEPVQVYVGSKSDYLFEKNNLFYSQPNETHYIVYATDQAGSGDRNPEQHPLSWWESNYPALFSGNLELEPAFVNASGHDFNLTQSSPMVDAGAFLTVATNSGSGTTLVVADAKYFFDGFGILGEQGDLIQIQGSTQTARVTSVNYSTNTLTLASSLSWNSGDKVSLAYNGNAPDLGAVESSFSDVCSGLNNPTACTDTGTCIWCTDTCYSGECCTPTDCGTTPGIQCINHNCVLPPTCSNGPITSECLCGTELKSSGLCCSGVWSAAPVCASAADCASGEECVSPNSCSAVCEELECSEGAIASACYCGGSLHSSGYCCSNVWQSSVCSGCVDMPALMGFIAQWKAGTLEMSVLMQKINAWKTQTGC